MKHLLLLHGAIGSKDQLNLLANSFSGNWEVHLYNFSGHGGRDMKDEFSIQVFADEVMKWINEKMLEPLTVFGYSMGGYVAMYIEKNHPGTFEKVITLGTKFQWSMETATKEVALLNPDSIEAKLPKFAAELQLRHHPNDWKKVVQKTADMLLAMGTNPPLKEADFTSFKTEVLLLVGDRDKMVTLEETIQVYKLIQSGKLCVLPNTPHPIEQVDHEMVSYFVRKFIQ